MVLFTKIDGRRFLLALIIVIILTGLSFLAALGSGKGLFSWLFIVFQFPTHSLFWKYFSQSTMMYRLGLITNIFFWTFIFERIFLIVIYLRRKNL